MVCTILPSNRSGNISFTCWSKRYSQVNVEVNVINKPRLKWEGTLYKGTTASFNFTYLIKR
ncbi:hypothetical protein GCM10007140_07920 [Priestia taiwanensis]|uniref:Uncharacterized protein n=1 Tax=Priestia taiwanensis TaxID=1347902 RepID=A0A917ALY5_9BACI|nr:hypothetical protein GCM10007140_07920 [Priestia taiwanensis]